MPNILSRLTILDKLFSPIQKILKKILPDFLEEDLKKPEVRNTIVLLAEQALVSSVPEARIVPTKLRQRIIRRILDTLLDEVLLPDADAQPDDRNALNLVGNLPSFEGFIVRLKQDLAPANLLADASGSLPGTDWSIDLMPGFTDTFLLHSAKTDHLMVGEAFTVNRKLQSLPGVLEAEPLFNAPIANSAINPVAAVGDSAPEDVEWSVNTVRAKEAWNISPPGNGKQQGEGILVGHPDTGYTLHREIDEPPDSRLLTHEGRDVWNNDLVAEDPLDDWSGSIPTAGFVGNPGHGTGTASVIMSGIGYPTGVNSGPWVTGIAPKAKLIPFRTAPTVVVLNQGKLASAIQLAVQSGVHVISISMGGLWSPTLHRAVQEAVNKGVIVCAAAGNYVGAWDWLPLVVWPAAFEEVIAVAASGPNDIPWTGSSRGRAVDITAPGHLVWHAIAEKGNLTKVAPGSGTSFAVTAVAGAAAVWLGFHGRENLLAKYGRAAFLPFVFKQVMQASCRKIVGWDTAKYGPGILDVESLLRQPLPDSVAIPVSGAAPDNESLAMFEGLPREQIRQQFARLLGVGPDGLAAALNEVGGELAFQLTLDLELRKQVHAALAGAVGVSVETNNKWKALKLAASPELALRLKA